MFMRKMVIIIGIAATLVHADYETLNLFGSIGAGFGMGGRLYTSSHITNNGTTITDRFYNYGGGVKFDVGMQYFMMENVALQGSFAYSVGGSIKEGTSTSNSSDITTYTRHLFGIKALVVPRFEALDLIDVYTGVGLGFFWNACHFNRVSKATAGTAEVKAEAEGKITSSPTLGFTGLLGADYPVNDKLTLFGEFAFEQMRFNLKKKIVKESSIPLMDVGTQYYSKDDSNNLDPEKVPGSNWQIRIGIRYALKTD